MPSLARTSAHRPVVTGAGVVTLLVTKTTFFESGTVCFDNTALLLYATTCSPVLVIGNGKFAVLGVSRTLALLKMRSLHF